MVLRYFPALESYFFHPSIYAYAVNGFPGSDLESLKPPPRPDPSQPETLYFELQGTGAWYVMDDAEMNAWSLRAKAMIDGQTTIPSQLLIALAAYLDIADDTLGTTYLKSVDGRIRERLTAIAIRSEPVGPWTPPPERSVAGTYHEYLKEERKSVGEARSRKSLTDALAKHDLDAFRAAIDSEVAENIFFEPRFRSQLVGAFNEHRRFALFALGWIADSRIGDPQQRMALGSELLQVQTDLTGKQRALDLARQLGVESDRVPTP